MTEKFTDKELDETINTLNQTIGSVLTDEELIEEYKRHSVDIGYRDAEDFNGMSDNEVLEDIHFNFGKDIIDRIEPDKLDYFFRNIKYIITPLFQSKQLIENNPSVVAAIIEKALETEIEYDIDRGILCDEAWQRIMSADVDDAIENNIFTIESSFTNTLDFRWAKVFADTIWYSLDADSQRKILPDLIKHIQEKECDETYIDNKYGKIKYLYAATDPEVLRELFSIEDLIFYESNKPKISYKDLPSDWDYGLNADEKTEALNSYDMNNLIPELFYGASEQEQRKLLKDFKANLLFLKDAKKAQFSGRILEYLTPELLKNEFTNLYDMVLDYGDNQIIGKAQEVLITRDDLPYEIDFDKIDIVEFEKIFEEYTIANDARAYEVKYVKYAEYLLKQDKYAITNNEYVAHIYNAMKVGQLEQFGFSQDQINSFKNLFDSIEIELVPDMTKFESTIKNYEPMSPELFEEFTQSIRVIRNRGELIPEEYCNYIIKESLNEESELVQNFPEHYGVFERAIEDKAKHILIKAGVKKDFLINVIGISSTDVNGRMFSDGMICFDRDKLYEMDETNLDFLDTMFHECRHAIQYDHMDNNMDKLKPIEYTMLKEELISEAFPGFYKSNYQEMYIEVDARISGARNQIRFLKEIGYSMQDILEMKGDKFQEIYKENQRKEIDRITKTGDRKKIEADEMLVNDVFAGMVKNHLGMLIRYPIFQIEFNQNGDRKSRLELFNRFAELVERISNKDKSVNVNEYRLISNNINKEWDLTPTEVLEELEALQTYQSSSNVVMKKMDKIIESGALNLFEFSQDNGLLIIDPNDTQEKQKENYERLIRGLQSYAKNHPDRELSTRILEETGPFLPNKISPEDEVKLITSISESISPVEINEGRTMLASYRTNQQNNLEEESIEQ